MRELEEQKMLLRTVFGSIDPAKQEVGLRAQRSLVLHRFYEVISNAFPIWYGMVDKDRFREVLYQFMQHGSKSHQIWRVPDEFRAFIKERNLFADTPYINDLLWFEWIEVELIMRKYSLCGSTEFGYDKEYVLGQNCALRGLDYKVFETGKVDVPGDYKILAYYHFGDQKVYFREISEVLFVFLKQIKEKGFMEAIDYISNLTGSTQSEVKKFFENTLNELHNLCIIKELDNNS